MIQKNKQLLDKNVDKDNNIWRTDRINTIWMKRIEKQTFSTLNLFSKILQQMRKYA